MRPARAGLLSSDELDEELSALFVVEELVVARAGGAEDDVVAGRGAVAGEIEGGGQIVGAVEKGDLALAGCLDGLKDPEKALFEYDC